jgi:hypothetical protein
MKALIALLVVAAFVLTAASALAKVDDYWAIMGPTPSADPPYEGGMIVDGGGSGFQPEFWPTPWVYYIGTTWWNQWYWDDPLSLDHHKGIDVYFRVRAVDPSEPAGFNYAVNYSTIAWSDLGYGDQLPPIPESMGEPFDEITYIERDIVAGDQIFSDQWAVYDMIEHIHLDWNPEWVSVDIWGYNFEIQGWIWHVCYDPSPVESSTWGVIKNLYR